MLNYWHLIDWCLEGSAFTNLDVSYRTLRHRWRQVRVRLPQRAPLENRVHLHPHPQSHPTNLMRLHHLHPHKMLSLNIRQPSLHPLHLSRNPTEHGALTGGVWRRLGTRVPPPHLRCGPFRNSNKIAWRCPIVGDPSHAPRWPIWDPNPHPTGILSLQVHPHPRHLRHIHLRLRIGRSLLLHLLQCKIMQR